MTNLDDLLTSVLPMGRTALDSASLDLYDNPSEVGALFSIFQMRELMLGLDHLSKITQCVPKGLAQSNLADAGP